MNAADFLGLYYVYSGDDAAELRVYEIQQHLKGVFLLVHDDDQRLVTHSTITNDVDNVFETRDEALAAIAGQTNRRNARLPQNDPFSSLLMDLSEDDRDLLCFIISMEEYAPHLFTGGILEGRTLTAVSLLDVQITTGLQLRGLVDSIVGFKKKGLLEVVAEPAAEPPHEEEYWLVINPQAVPALERLAAMLEDVA